jgi:hypothetical protein
MLKFLFTILFVILLQHICYSQTESSFGCKFLEEIFNYIKIGHKERVQALKKIGGVIEYSYVRKKIKYKNTSTLPDSSFNSIVKKYDLINLVDDPLVNKKYKINIIVDTINFFSENCKCLANGSDSSYYKISNKWIVNKDIHNDTQLIRLANIFIEKGMLVIVLNSNRSPYYFGYFYFELASDINPELRKIKWLQPQYDIDNF